MVILAGGSWSTSGMTYHKYGELSERIASGYPPSKKVKGTSEDSSDSLATLQSLRRQVYVGSSCIVESVTHKGEVSDVW